MRRSVVLATLLIASISIAADGDVAPLREPVATLDDGDAEIRYLGHAGWLVRTNEHHLVFDYTGPIDDGALDEGRLSPEVFTGAPTILFVSHAHGDHDTPDIRKLRDAVLERGGTVTLALGWDDPGSAPVVVPPDGAWVDVLGAKVFALHHEFDGIPEGFFLVRSGGVTIYHSGDHGTWSDPPNETFRQNIDRLANAAERIDLAFVSSFGDRRTRRGLNAGDVYTLTKLEPRITFPMHCGGCEEQYAEFAREAEAKDLPTRVVVALRRGESFRYAKGDGLLP